MRERIAVVMVLVVTVSLWARAQSAPPPVEGLTGSIGIQGTIDKFYRNTHRAIVKTADGVHHLVHVDGHTSVHGGDGAARNPLAALTEGSQVVVHYMVKGGTKTAVEIDQIGNDGLGEMEGTVLGVDRAAKKLTVLLADDAIVTLRLTNRAASDVGHEIPSRSRVVVYFADEHGEQVAHYFKVVR